MAQSESRKAYIRLCRELAEFSPRLYAVSRDGQSYYIHFDALPRGATHKLRISDHDERSRYGYKWQLRLDGIHNIGERKPHSFYFNTIPELVAAFRKYYLPVNIGHSQEVLDNLARKTYHYSRE